jgi:tetratricopeptide (TPR) repeat protein
MAHLGHRIQEPFWSRLWNTVKPPPPVPGHRKPLNRGQRGLLWGTLSVVISGAVGFAIYNYVSSAEERADKVFQKGMALLGPGRYQDAIAQFTGAIAIWPKHAQAFLQRGNARQILNQTDAALSDYAMALNVDPNLAPVYTARGIIFLTRGDVPQALMEFDQSIRVQPTVDAYYQRGQIHYRSGEFQQAIDDYDRAIGIGRDMPYVYLARAIAKGSMGDIKGAERDRDTAATLQTVRY